MQNLETSNTIKPIPISGEEYVIIKDLKKQYEKKRKKLVNEIYNEIKEEINKGDDIGENDLKNTRVINL